MSALSFQSVTQKTRGLGAQQTLLSDISFSVAEGTVCGLVGHNGAGKSTLLNLASGLSTPTMGQIGIFGAPPTTIIGRAHCGYATEHASFPATVSTREVLGLHQALTGNNGVDIEALLERVGLQQHRQAIGKFSKGMRQRLALAVALLGLPKILLLDEPMSGLDPVGRAIVRRVLVEERQRGATIIFSSHVLSDIATLCDQVLVIREGRLVLDESVAGADESWLISFEPGQDLSRLGSAPQQDAIEIAETDVWQVARDVRALGLRILSVAPQRRALERRVLPLLEVAA